MKQIDTKTKCYICIGCNRLEEEPFKGEYNCLNYTKAETAEEQKINLQIQKCKEILEGKQMKI